MLLVGNGSRFGCYSQSRNYIFGLLITLSFDFLKKKTKTKNLSFSVKREKHFVSYTFFES